MHDRVDTSDHQPINGRMYQDPTAPESLTFMHANDAKPLATPWDVATMRARHVLNYRLKSGYILDCACGSGLQLAAYASTLRMPTLGIELDTDRARASAFNLKQIALLHHAQDDEWYRKSVFISGDGTDASGALNCAQIDQRHPSVALLILDPARPRNSRTHDINEMQPAVGEVLQAWKPHLIHHGDWPAVILDLSPRLVETQREQLSHLVQSIWPGIPMSWSWASKGGGRVDRLELWVGKVVEEGIVRKFVRIAPTPALPSFVLKSRVHTTEPPLLHGGQPARGEFVTLLDAAVVESGLWRDWLHARCNGHMRWSVIEGRRPQFHHDEPFQFMPEHERLLIQATGKIVEFFRLEITPQTVDELAAMLIDLRFERVKLRCAIEPEWQPMIQGSLDRQLKARGGHRQGFITAHHLNHTFLICEHHERED